MTEVRIVFSAPSHIDVPEVLRSLQLVTERFREIAPPNLRLERVEVRK